jgi:flagellar export protein FliJ
MKRFEFRLHRVLDLRRQQADVHRHRLQMLMARLKELDVERAALEAKVAEARTSVRSSPVTGNDLVSLAQYETHIRRRCVRIAEKRIELEKQLETERNKTREVERKVKLLEKLETKKRAEWETEANKELETLSADSYLSRMQLARTEHAAAEYSRRTTLISEVDV